ncbi:MAG TPA: HAD family phosphatase [Membranihabitans sp.]|nr:HAD family phosphatase [Membranihabitans sp.]
MIQNIIFDLGGVLVNWDPIYLYRKIFEDEISAVEFLGNVCTYEWNLEQDRGRTLSEATNIKIREFPEYEAEIRAYYDRWPEMFQGTIDENVQVLRELLDSSQHRVFALTNWSRETFPIAKSLFPFFNEFEGAVVSGEEGLIKPDPEIYKLLLRKYNLIPENSVFIDDRLENVEAARALNIHGIHYQHPVISLREELSGLVF